MDRFGFIEMDGDPMTLGAREQAKPPAKAGEVMLDRVDGIKSDQSDLVKAGLRVGGEFFALGSRISGYGDEIMRGRRMEAEECPRTEEGLTLFYNRIAGENRQHIKGLQSAKMIVDPRDGCFGMFHPDEHGWHAGWPTETAWQHIGGWLAMGENNDGQREVKFPGLSQYLRSVPSNEVRARLVALHSRLMDPEQRLSMAYRIDPKKRLHNGKNMPQVFRVGGPRYAPIEPTQIVNVLKANLPRTWAIMVDYNGESWCIDAFDMSPRPVGEGDAVGDVFRVGIRVRGDDVRQGSFTIQAYAERIRCLNASILTSSKNCYKRKHIGNVEKIGEEISHELAKVRGYFERFTNAWSAARKAKIIDEGAGKSPEVVMQALVRAGLVPSTGGKENVAQALVKAWYHEPGNDLAAVANAVTRCAQDFGPWWQNLDVSTEAEEQGTALVYNRLVFGQVERAIAEMNEQKASNASNIELH